MTVFQVARDFSCLWRYIPIADYPGWGLLQHLETKQYLWKGEDWFGDFHPYTRKFYDYQSLFSMMQDTRTIRHISGLNFHPMEDILIPKEGALLSLAKGTGSATKFAGRDSSNLLADVHSTRVPGGHWEILLQRITPKISYEETLTVKTGFEQSREIKLDVELGGEIGASFAGMSAKINYSIKYGQAAKATWYSETTREQKWQVYAGQTVCVYQWVFDGEYDSLKMDLKSNIYQDTDCVDSPKNLMD